MVVPSSPSPTSVPRKAILLCAFGMDGVWWTGMGHTAGSFDGDCACNLTQELLISYVETLSAEADAMMNSPRWTDPDLALQANVGEISAEALGRAEAVLEGLLQDRVHRAKWFGAHVTEPVGGPDPAPLNPEMDWREFVQTVSSLILRRSHRPSEAAAPAVKQV
jgi:hypothetical protein